MKRIFFCLGFIIVIITMYIFLTQPRLIFIEKEIHLSLYEEVHPYTYIKSMSHINKDDIQIKNFVDSSTLGQYTIEYQYYQKKFVLVVFVDDTMKPKFDTKRICILKGDTLSPDRLVENIQDDSKTTVSFDKEYIFDEVKTYTVKVTVKDAYGNKETKTTYVLVEEKDIQAPTLEGMSKIIILIGEQIDLKKDVYITDNHDLNPEYIIDDSSVNIRKTGEYEVYYITKDKSGNEQTYTRYVEVLSQYSNRDTISDGIKTCYLTFDDGPSPNTKMILDILDKYGIKATFFVAGTSPKDYHYIRESYQRGHAIGLHTYSHNYELIYSSLKNYLKDLNQIKEVVYQQTGEYARIMRFPGGSSNLVSKKYNIGIMKRLTRKVIDLGYQYFDWSSINGDGEGIKTINELKKKSIEEIGDKEDIMFLMHDSANREETVKALPAIIEYLKKKDYEFKVIEEKSPTFHHTIQN